MFAATVRVTVPLAVPLCPDEMEIHAASLTAFHAQPVSVPTSTDSRPPAAVTTSEPRLRLNWQAAAA